MSTLWERIKTQVNKDRETIKNEWQGLKKDWEEIDRKYDEKKKKQDEEYRIYCEKLDREEEEQAERKRRFKAKDKTLVLTRSEYFWWKIFPIIVKLIGIILALFVVFIYGVWYFVIIPLFVGYLLLELFFWHINR